MVNLALAFARIIPTRVVGRLRLLKMRLKRASISTFPRLRVFRVMSKAGLLDFFIVYDFFFYSFLYFKPYVLRDLPSK